MEKRKSTKKNRRETKIKKSLKNNKIRQIFVNSKFSDSYMKSKEGEYFDENYYDEIIKSDCDCYRIDENGDYKLLFKLRKKVIPNKLCKVGIDNLKKAAMKSHDNRGASAGIIDYKKLEKYLVMLMTHLNLIKLISFV